MTDRKVVSQTSVIKTEIDGTFESSFGHADAPFTNFFEQESFFIGSEVADTVSATSEPIKTLSRHEKLANEASA